MAYGLNMERARQRADEADRKKSFSDRPEIRWYGWKKNKANLLRICPPGSDADNICIPFGDLAMQVWTHWEIPPKGAHCRCIQQTYPERGESCPVCEAVAEMREWFQRDGIDQATQRSFLGKHRVSARCWTNCIDRDGTIFLDDNGQVVSAKAGAENVIPATQVLGMPISVYNWVMRQIREPVIGDITDVESGLDLMVTVNGTGINTEYANSFVPERRPLEGDPENPNPEMREKILKSMYNVGEIFSYPQKERYDKIVGIAYEVRKLIGNPDAIQPDAEEVENTAEISTDTGAGQKPPCYSNHMVTTDGKSPFKKCIVCPFEAPCMEETERLEVSEATRRKVHGV